MIAGLHPYETPAPAREAGNALHGKRASDPALRIPTLPTSDPMLGTAELTVATIEVSPLVTRSITPYERIKHLIDFGLASVLLLVFAPLIAIAAVFVRLTSSGPAFYSQVRLGERGKRFRIHKLRTMYHNCESVSGAKWSVPGDSRITPIGNFLRRTHIDELPQLVNVLKGEMSLVGPRPERPEIVPILEQAIPRYQERLQIRPGVTGLAQLRLPADTSIESVRSKLAYDLLYIQAISPWLDLRLMACTIFKMFKLPLKLILRLTRIPALGSRTPGTHLAVEPA